MNWPYTVYIRQIMLSTMICVQHLQHCFNSKLQQYSLQNLTISERCPCQSHFIHCKLYHLFTLFTTIYCPVQLAVITKIPPMRICNVHNVRKVNRHTRESDMIYNNMNIDSVGQPITEISYTVQYQSPMLTILSLNWLYCLSQPYLNKSYTS